MSNMDDLLKAEIIKDCKYWNMVMDRIEKRLPSEKVTMEVKEYKG